MKRRFDTVNEWLEWQQTVHPLNIDFKLERILSVYTKLNIPKIANKIIKNLSIEESIAKLHPLKRIGEGVDSANLANFLLTTKSSWITGQIIAVDGGRSTIA